MSAAPRLALFLALLAAACAAPRPHRGAEIEDGWIEALLDARPKAFAPYLDAAAEHRLQILVSEVVEGPDGPRLERHGFRVGAEYFYPASAIKLCSAIAALEWLAEESAASAAGLDTPLRFHPLLEDETLEDSDPSNLTGGAITVGHEVRKLFLVSDNRAHNRLFELVGHRALNERMWAAGLPSVRSVHRLSEARSFEDNLRTPRVELLLAGGAVRVVPERESQLWVTSYGVPRHTIDAAFAGDGEMTPPPSDFGHKNSISLLDLQNALVLLARPDVELGLRGFALPDAYRAFALAAMTEQPAASDNPAYPADDYPLDRLKYLMRGAGRVLPRDELMCANKVGRAYGFTIDNAYVEHGPSGRAFFATAVLYTNPNRVLNDGVYAYADLADPFFADLGEELTRALLAP
ncbi:MAG: serine hydrolase [Planctomycetota bacterium]